MRTHLVFRNAALTDPDADDANPAGAKLARLVADHLPVHGFPVKRVVQEDWGWAVVTDNPCFGLWIGCGADIDRPNGHLCFIEPSRPWIRRWFRRVDTTATIARLAAALETIAAEAAGTSELRWWSEDEVRQQ